MKKNIQIAVLILPILFIALVSGCDIFENFLFNVPATLKITSVGVPDPFGSGSFDLDSVNTYRDYKDRINSIVFVETYVVTEAISDTTIRGNGTLSLYAGSDASGQLLAEHTAINIRPADYMKPNAYKVNFNENQVMSINNALASGVTEFYGEYVVVVTAGGIIPPNILLVRIDMLFLVDADL
jgi:hypothetical protein